jgi:FkbH-like protein
LRLQALCRNLAATNRCAEAITALKESTRRSKSLRVLLANEKLLRRIKPAIPTTSSRECRIAILGNSTFDLLAPALRICAFAAGIHVETYQGAYGQHHQEILDSSSGLAAFHPSVVFLALDWRSFGLPEVQYDHGPGVKTHLKELQSLWRHCRERFHALVIQHNFEVPATSAYGRLSMAMESGRARLIQQLNLALWSAASAESGVHILDLDQIASAYGKNRWDDPSLWHAAKQYPAADALPVLARHQVALLRASLGLSPKCLALDLDGTLWGGVIGEDGISGICLGGSPEGHAYCEFQAYLKSLKERGIILTVCSKNNEVDAKAAFTSHPEMILSLRDIALFQADWSPKDQNLRKIAKALNIGLESMVFLDDSPVERAWIRRQLPEVQVPELPADPALFIKALDQQLYFEGLEVTADDRNRAEYYRANLERDQFEAASSGLEDFLARLQMRVELRPFDKINLARITQLINKTNQFNLTTSRLTENQVNDLIDSSDQYTQFMRVRDRYGENGITGVLIASRQAGTLQIDNWLMSCRVLGRKLEEVMLTALLRYAHAVGCKSLVGLYRPTDKNLQVANLYERFGFDLLESIDSGEKRYRIPVAIPAEYPSRFVVEDFTQPSAPIAEEIAPGISPDRVHP